MAAMQTKKNEIKFTTTEPEQMIGKYLASDARKSWSENFVDDSTGESVPIERYETIFPIGTLIDNNVLAKIKFYMLAGDIQQVEVSNQKREAILANYLRPVTWSVKAEINGKKYHFLLYSKSIETALEITQDFIEQNYVGRFRLIQAKSFKDCIFIYDNLSKEIEVGESVKLDGTEEGDADKNFYQIEADILSSNSCAYYRFIVNSKDVDSATTKINVWISQNMKEQQLPQEEYKIVLISAVVIPCNRVIEYEFSQSYEEA